VSTQVLAALISGVVAIFVAGGSAILTWAQIRRERNKWQIEVKMTYATELHKTRLSSYPEVFRILSELSHGGGDQVTAEKAGNVAKKLNSWFYSAGGMCADATTRGAILGLRKSCERWERTGRRPDELYGFRNIAIAFLRRDLDVGDLNESYDFDEDSTLLGRLRRDLATMDSKDQKYGSRKFFHMWGN
jgi:hypothetical protein